MTRLPRGVTGFGSAGRLPRRSADSKLFKARCYDLARANGGAVVTFLAAYDGSCRNYHAVELDIDGSIMSIWCNAHAGIVAVIQRGQFADAPQLTRVFASEYCVLSKAEAEASVAAADLRELDESERAQVAYWQPKRVGDVIFNCWD